MLNSADTDGVKTDENHGSYFVWKSGGSEAGKTKETKKRSKGHIIKCSGADPAADLTETRNEKKYHGGAGKEALGDRKPVWPKRLTYQEKKAWYNNLPKKNSKESKLKKSKAWGLIQLCNYHYLIIGERATKKKERHISRPAKTAINTLWARARGGQPPK